MESQFPRDCRCSNSPHQRLPSLVGNLRARRVQCDALCPLDALESARFSGPPQTRSARFPINSKHLSDIHHFKPHSADSSPGRGITRPCWRPHSRPEILGSRTGSVNLNTNRLHHHYSLRDIQLLPIVPPMRIRTHRKWNSLRNHVHLGIRDWILHLHRWNSRFRPVPRLEQQPGQNHCDPSRRSLRPNQPTDRLKPRSSFLNHWRA